MEKNLECILVLLTGVLFAYWVNFALFSPLIISFEERTFWFLVFPVLIIILYFVSFHRFKALKPYKKGRIFLLGASIISLMFASYNFCIMTQPVMTITPLTFTNLYKAILLASFFSFMERLLKFFEDTSILDDS